MYEMNFLWIIWDSICAKRRWW